MWESRSQGRVPQEPDFSGPLDRLGTWASQCHQVRLDDVDALVVVEKAKG